MINTSKFKQSLKQGEDFEIEVVELIKPKHPDAYRPTKSSPYYDIVLPGLKKTMECKLDLSSERTGNFFIETEFDDSPSGLTYTKAEYWAHGNLEWVYIIDISTLRELVSDYEIRSYPGEGGHTARAHLLPKDVYINAHGVAKIKRLKDYDEIAEDYEGFSGDDLRYIDLVMVKVL